MATADTPIESSVFEAHRLVAEYPPALRNRNKGVVYEIACPTGCTHGGRVAYSRWRAMSLPGRVTPAAALRHAERREDVYDYAPALKEAGAVEWHVNFAAPNLFVAYGSGLFAQDRDAGRRASGARSTQGGPRRPGLFGQDRRDGSPDSDPRAGCRTTLPRGD